MAKVNQLKQAQDEREWERLYFEVAAERFLHPDDDCDTINDIVADIIERRTRAKGETHV